MIQFKRLLFVTTVVLLSMPGAMQITRGQGGQAVSAARQADAVSTAVRFDVVMSRLKGTTPVSSTPYQLYTVISDNGASANVRQGFTVWTGRENSRTGEDGVRTTTHETQWVGTQVDILIAGGRGVIVDGVTTVNVRVNESAPYAAGNESRPLNQAIESLTISSLVRLRAGVKTEFFMGTDKTTGETVRGEVTLTILK